MRQALAIAVLAAVCAVATPALADRRGGRDDSAHAEHAAVTREQAIETARQQGVATVREVRLRDGVWKVEGHTDGGRAIEVEIDAHSGAVVKRELY